MSEGERLNYFLNYFLSRFLRFNNIKRRNQSFNNFINDNITTININKVGQLNVVIAGSDQIWNPFLTNGIDNIYTLQDSRFSKIKKIGYAISGEPSCISKEEAKVLGKNIETFDFMSVREESLRQLFKQYCVKDIKLCVDPTLLLNKNIWADFASKRLIKEKYVFVYQVVHSDTAMILAKNKAKELNAKLLFLNTKFSIRWKEKNISNSIGPREFVSLIKYADYIVTTSFHGTALSIMLQKQFVVVGTGKTDRQKNLLSILSLSNRMVNSISQAEGLSAIDYTKIELDKIVEDSKLFLKQLG